MGERWHQTYLNVEFPPVPAEAYYQLLHIGPLRRHPTRSSDVEAAAYFECQRGAQGDARLITQQVNLQRAALLVPGTRWSAAGQLLSDGSHAYPDYRTVSLGARAPRLRRLAQVMPADAVLPTALHTLLRDAWYAVVEGETEQVLIPCFELLRAFYYQAGGKMVDYFFSRLPLDSVCWPVMAPTSATDFTAHFCVATQLDRPHQARVLAEMLFNPHYRATIERAQSELAQAWHARAMLCLAPEAHVKATLRLGRAVRVEAQGTAFTVGTQAFFWVSRLILPADWFSFRAVVYHPLRPYMGGTLYGFRPAFTDVLRRCRPPEPKAPPAPTVPIVDYRSFGGFTRQYEDVHHAGPPVQEAFPWADAVPPAAPPVFADAQATDLLWARPGKYPTGTGSRLPSLPVFQQLLRYFRKHGCLVQRLEVNNPSRRLGIGRSVFPYACAPTIYTHLPDRRQRPLGIARIEKGGGTFYVIYMQGHDRVALVFRRDLTPWSANDCNKLLSHAAQHDHEWEHAGGQLFCPSLQRFIIHISGPGESMRQVAGWCNSWMGSAVRSKVLVPLDSILTAIPGLKTCKGDSGGDDEVEIRNGK